jgi:hypothetical protein
VESKACHDFELLVNQIPGRDTVKYELRSEIGFLSDRLEVYSEQKKIGLIVLSQDMAASINEHKGQSLQDFVRALKIPLLITPKQRT